jgi:hypothetical protein
MTHNPRTHPDEFDDELEDIEEFIPPSARPVVEEINRHVLPSDAIVIEKDIGTRLPHRTALLLFERHFDHSDLGSRSVSEGTVKLRVKPSRYPWFGAWTGYLHLVEDLAARRGEMRIYTVSGGLRYRVSVLYVTFIVLLVFVLLWWFSPGFWLVVTYFVLLVGVLVGSGYGVGRGEREEIVDRIEESMLRLRGTLQNS